MDNVDEAEEEGHLRGHLGYVSKEAALGQDLSNWGQTGRSVSSRLRSWSTVQVSSQAPLWS